MSYQHHASLDSKIIKDKIENILDGLIDENNIQLIVYNLFEKVKPEEVKKIVEGLKRTLEYKTEEVKKGLSLNHEHLFSCTDLIDKLKEYTIISVESINKIKKLDSMRKEIRSRIDDKINPENKPDSYLKVSSSLYYNDVLDEVKRLFDINPASCIALYTYCQNDTRIPHNILMSCCLSLLNKSSMLLRSCLKSKSNISQSYIQSIYQIFSIGWNLSSINSSAYIDMKIQSMWAFYKVWDSSISIDSFKNISKSSDAFRIIIVDILDKVKTTGEDIDIIELLKILVLLDKRKMVRITKDNEDISDIMDHCYNYKLDNISYDEYMNELDVIDSIYTLDDDKDSSFKYVDIYKDTLPSLISNIGLIDDSNIRYRFDIVNRYCKDRNEIDEWERMCGIEKQYTLKEVIHMNWISYCEIIISSLDKKLNIVDISNNIPSSSHKDMNIYTRYMKTTLDNILQSIQTIDQIVGIQDVQHIDTIDFRHIANSKISTLLSSSYDTLLSNIQQSNDILYILKMTIFAWNIVSHDSIRSILSDHIGTLYNILSNMIHENTHDYILSSLQYILSSSMYIDYSHPILSTYIDHILLAMDTRYNIDSIVHTDRYIHMRSLYPCIVPFIIDDEIDVQYTTYNIDSDANSVIHSEYIDQYRYTI